MKTISGPTLQTFYTCYTDTEKCKYFSGGPLTKGVSCKKGLVEVRFSGGLVKTPIECPLLGKTQEEDISFDKDVLMRNL